MLKRSLKFNESDLKRIEAAVKDVERRSSVEVVPLFLARADAYSWTHLYFAFAGAAIGTLAALLVSHLGHWVLSPENFVAYQFLGSVLGLVIGSIPMVRRAFIRESLQAQAVHSKVVQAFLEHGLTKTKDRTGVLIALSAFEHRVEILADEGISAKVGKEFWEDQVKDIVNGVHKNCAASAIIDVIERVGALVEGKLPIQPSDKNELGDHVRIDE